MIKKLITYTDFNDVKHQDLFYFHLSRAELLGIDDLLEQFNKAVEENDNNKSVRIFIELIAKAYGEKSEDGLGFKKSQEISDRFIGSPAFDALFEELTSSPEAMTNFFTGMLPANLQNRASLPQNS